MNTDRMIFCFGSNEAGIHGAGAALYAFKNKGAKWGKGYGPSGYSFALPTKDKRIKTLPINKIAAYVDAFIRYAHTHPQLKFQVTQLGCGLAGFKPEQIAPLFIGAATNCYFDIGWKDHLPATAKFWN